MKRFRLHAKGLATVEMALILPILCLLTFGVMEYGWMFLKAHQINNAARNGARVAVTIDATTTQVTSSISTMMTKFGMGASGYSVTISPGVSQVPTGQTVTVSLLVPYNKIKLLGLPFLPVPSSLTASVSMAKEGL